MRLIPGFERQDQIFARAFSILEDAIRDRVFPAASVAVTLSAKLIVLKSLGRLVYEEELEGTGGAPLLADGARSGNPEISTTALFDLASLTKPIATTTMAMILYERGLLDLEAPVVGIVPEFLSNPDPGRRGVTFRMLLAHSSGLPAYEKLFLKTASRDELLRAAFATPLTADPGSRAEYSDIGFILLGVALERIAEERLDRFCQRELFGPLGMLNTTFNPPAELRPKIPPTSDERRGRVEPDLRSNRTERNSATEEKTRSTFRNRVIQGEVQDENAFVLGGVAGHAGLFSTAEDIALFSQCMLNLGTPIVRPETISLFTRRESSPPGTSRTLGWDTPTPPSQSGRYFGSRSYGHLGYTGTSLWIDPDRELSITLLTNRTWPDCSNQAIKQVRPRFHDAVIEALG